MIKRIKGFSLIELMIVVAVIGILAAIAYPNYTDYVRKARRATAQSALMEIANKEQTYQLSRRTYTNVKADLGFVDPSELNSFYDITITSDGLTFKAEAKPKGAQATSGEATLSVDNVGTKSPTTAGYWGK